MAKTYTIYCVTKANGHKYLHRADVSADSVKEAKDYMKRAIRIRLGRHAFSLATKPAGEIRWEVVAKRLGMTVEQLCTSAVYDGGLQFE